MYRRYIRGEISHLEKFNFFSAYCTHASEGGDLPYSTGMFYNETAMLYSKSGAGFRSRPVLGRLRLLVNENIGTVMLKFFKTDYELSKIRSKLLTHIGHNLCLL